MEYIHKIMDFSQNGEDYHRKLSVKSALTANVLSMILKPSGETIIFRLKFDLNVFVAV